MYVSTTEASVPEAMTIAVTEDTLTAELSDGRTISVPLAWYPRLVQATPEERSNWELIGGGQGHPLAGLGRRHQRGNAAGRPKVGGEPPVFSAMAGGEEGRTGTYAE